MKLFHWTGDLCSVFFVPNARILMTVAIYVVGVVLNYLVPSQVFEIVLNISSLGVTSTWGFIVLKGIVATQFFDTGRHAALGKIARCSAGHDGQISQLSTGQTRTATKRPQQHHEVKPAFGNVH